MKWYKRMTLPILFMILSAVSIISIRVISQVSNYGKLINYVGIVRGASQRVIKLETNGEKSDELIGYVSDILDELITGEGRYGLVAARDKAYNECLAALKIKWNIVKDEIYQVREGEASKQLLAESEELFQIANETVFAMEAYSHKRTTELVKLFFVTALICVGYFVMHIRRFFELKNKNEHLEDLAKRDKLTGAYSLSSFKSEADIIISNNPNTKFAVLYLDIENFKYINDIMGYSFGDDILKKYAALMMKSLGKNELFGRNVADRFMVLKTYQNKEELLRAQKEADRVFLKSVMGSEGKQIITVACGICCIEDVLEKLDTEGLLDRANYAQKTVKNDPGLHYAFYNEDIRNTMRKETEIRNRIGEALANQEFLVYYQPKVGLMSGRIEGAEALVRWQTPDRGLIPPDLFIPVLEKNHSISQLDQYVFEQVCIWMTNRMRTGKRIISVSVNVSKIQFYNPNFAEIYAGIKNKYQIPDQMIEIEFTETAAFDNQSYIIEIVNELHKNGFRCSLDDFGKGYSSLGMLKELPIDTLKLDAMFFRECLDMDKENTIIRNIVSMINELNITSVAEGIESQEQVEFLRSIGCGMVQGYVFYKPMPEEKLDDILAEGQEGLDYVPILLREQLEG